MIKSIKNKGLRQFWETGSTQRLAVPAKNAKRLQFMLEALDAATKPSDMNLPGLEWHSLAPGQPGRWTTKVSGNYRLTYAWADGAVDVDLEDYH